jgi:hypothetical protein
MNTHKKERQLNAADFGGRGGRPWAHSRDSPCNHLNISPKHANCHTLHADALDDDMPSSGRASGRCNALL